MFLHGVRQAPFARGIVAFAFAFTIAGTHQSPFDDIAWVLRLNRMDFEELSAAVRAEIARFISDTASSTAREAAARALRLLGSLEAQRDAEALSPLLRPQVRDKSVNPLDPEAQAPADVAIAAERVGRIDPAAVWTHMSMTSEDRDLEHSQELLVRFEPERIMTFLDRVAATVSSRTSMPPRQLGWHLPWLSPIIGTDTVEAIGRRVREVTANRGLVPEGDENFVTGMMVEGAMPRLDAEGQLDLLQSVPTEAPFYMRYTTLAKPLSSEAERRLSDVMNAHPSILERTLLFLSANAGAVSDGLRRHLLISCLGSEDLEVRAAAADFARGSGDVGLDEAMLGLEAPDDNDDSWRSAVIRSGSPTSGRSPPISLSRSGLPSMPYAIWHSSPPPHHRRLTRSASACSRRRATARASSGSSLLPSRRSWGLARRLRKLPVLLRSAIGSGARAHRRLFPTRERGLGRTAGSRLAVGLPRQCRPRRAPGTATRSILPTGSD